MEFKSSSDELAKNINLSKLLGLLLTDGSVKHESRTYRIVYAGSSEELHKEFKKLVQKLFQIETFYERRDTKGIKITTYSSVNAGKFLVKTCNTFRTKACETFPVCGKFRNRNMACINCKPKTIGGIQYPSVNTKILENLSKGKLLEVFKLMFSADGGVVLGVKWHKKLKRWEFTRRIVLKCSHPELRKKYRKLLQKTDIETKEWDSSIAIDTKHDIEKFSKTIGFVDGVEASRKSLYWYGFEKNSVLEKLLKTYNFDQKFWKGFTRKEDIINFLRAA